MRVLGVVLVIKTTLMVKRQPARVARVGFAPDVSFASRRDKLRKRCLVRLLAQPQVRRATAARLEQVIKQHETLYGADRGVTKDLREREDACRVAMRVIVLAKRLGVFETLEREGPLAAGLADDRFESAHV